MTAKFGSAILVAVGSLVCLGAGQTLGPSRRPLTASLRTDSAEIGVRHGGFQYHANIGFTYTNTTAGPVSMAGCGGPPFPRLQKKVNGQWVTAYYPNYLLCRTTPDFRVKSGQSYHDVLQFWAFEPGHVSGATLMVDSIDGIYRLRRDFREGIDAYANDARAVESTSK